MIISRNRPSRRLHSARRAFVFICLPVLLLAGVGRARGAALELYETGAPDPGTARRRARCDSRGRLHGSVRLASIRWIGSFTAKRAAADGLLGDDSEPAFDPIEPTGVGRRVVNLIARVMRQPAFNPRMFVGGLVVGDEVNVECRRHVAVEMINKGQKFLVAMAWL